MPIQRCCKFLTSTCFPNLRFLVISLCVQHKNITLASKTLTQMVSRLKLGDWAGTQILSKCFFVSRLSSTLSSYWLSARSGSREYILHRAQGKVRSCKMGCFCDCKMDQVFFQVSSFPLTIQSQRHICSRQGGQVWRGIHRQARVGARQRTHPRQVATPWSKHRGSYAQMASVFV